MVTRTIDARGRTCPIPIIQLNREVKLAEEGDDIEVLSDDAAFPADVEAWCKKTQHELLELGPRQGWFRAVVRKRWS
jgi:TusA-related sulfurtransferase